MTCAWPIEQSRSRLLGQALVELTSTPLLPIGRTFRTRRESAWHDRKASGLVVLWSDAGLERPTERPLVARVRRVEFADLVCGLAGQRCVDDQPQVGRAVSEEGGVLEPRISPAQRWTTTKR